MEKLKSVLIVEDDLNIRESLKHLIELEGFVVFTADNGEEALQKLNIISQAQKPCLVLVDFMMPKMNGEELINAMKEDTVLTAIPVVMVSSLEKPKSVTRFMKKPYCIDSILSLLRQFCA